MRNANDANVPQLLLKLADVSSCDGLTERSAIQCDKQLTPKEESTNAQKSSANPKTLNVRAGTDVEALKQFAGVR